MTLLGGAEVSARRKRRRAPNLRLFHRGLCGAAPGPRPKQLPSGIARRAEKASTAAAPRLPGPRLACSVARRRGALE
eukprot:5172066-Alexandrium_andersonii.AAC.1